MTSAPYLQFWGLRVALKRPQLLREQACAHLGHAGSCCYRSQDKYELKELKGDVQEVRE